jgi:molecular chaperone GrpE
MTSPRDAGARRREDIAGDDVADDAADGALAEVGDLDPAAAEADPSVEAPGDLDHDGMTAEEEELFVDGTPGRSDLAAERDEYLDALKRVKAEFDNYRKRTDKERLQMIDRASETIVSDLLPVLDACDAAIAHGDEGVTQIHALLTELLGKSGLERIEPVGKPFDPTHHEAVLREEGEGEADTVVEVMRSGYTWRGRVLRPAMVKVRA